MTKSKKTYRLGIAAREFNVSSGRIVEVLNKHGFEIENSPNTRLKVEMMDIVIKEFDSERAVKEKAEQLNIEIFKNTTTPQTEEETVIEEVSAETKEVTIKSNIIETPVEAVIKPKLSKPIVKGKIDLEPKKSEEKASSKKKTEKEEAKEEPAKTAEKKASPKKESKKSTDTKKTEKPETKNVVETEVPVVSKPVTVGFIDLDALEPKGKSKPEEKEKPAAEKKKRKKAEQKPQKEQESKPKDTKTEQKEEKEIEKEKDSNVHVTQYQKLEGPVIMGKIDLPVEKENKPVASSDGSKRKKKRRRIKNKAVDTASNAKNTKTREKKTKEVKKADISEEEIEN